MIGWAFLSAGTALVAAPFIAEAFRPRLTDKRRAAATGQVADLPNGPTWFQWRGPRDGPVAVCVHGLTTPSFVWGPLADHLAGLGFCVLTYDLYGRGLSARPKGEQDSAFFNAQLAALLDHQISRARSLCSAIPWAAPSRRALPLYTPTGCASFA